MWHSCVMYIYFWQLLNHIILLLFCVIKCLLIFRHTTSPCPVSHVVVRGQSRAKCVNWFKNCAVVRCGSIPDMIRYIIYIYTMVDHKCHKKYVVDPTWKVKIFIVIIIFVLKKSPDMKRCLRKHMLTLHVTAATM